MNSIRTTILTLVLCGSAWCQTTTTPPAPTPIPTVTVPFKVVSLPASNTLVAFSPYAIKWNTATGQVWLLVFSNTNPGGPTSIGPRGQTAINSTALADGSVLGRFSINVLDKYPNIVLLDEIAGDAWLINITGGPASGTFTHLDDMQ